MRRTLRSLLLAVMLASPVACISSTKVGQGQLYQSGDTRYDAYFHAIHDQQSAAASWPDEKKNARRPLVSALALTPDASDDALVRGTKDRAAKKDGSINTAVEETRRSELDRASRLKAASARLEELAKQGKTHEEEAKKEYENRGAMKADEKKSEHLREVRRELDAAVDVASSLSRDAKKNAQAAEDFADDLARAIGQDPGKRPPPEEKKPEEKKPEAPPPPPPPHHKPKPPPPPPQEKPKPPPPAEKPPPPAEKPKPPDEVFNP